MLIPQLIQKMEIGHELIDSDRLTYQFGMITGHSLISSCESFEALRGDYINDYCRQRFGCWEVTLFLSGK